MSPDCLRLTDEIKSLLQRKRTFLIDFIWYKDLSNLLYEHGVISNDHKSFIQAGEGPREKCKRFLDILNRRCIKDYQLFLTCLRSAGSGHVAEALETQGGRTTFTKVSSSCNLRINAVIHHEDSL